MCATAQIYSCMPRHDMFAAQPRGVVLYVYSVQSMHDEEWKHGVPNNIVLPLLRIAIHSTHCVYIHTVAHTRSNTRASTQLFALGERKRIHH